MQLRLLGLLALSALTGCAADVTGTWKGTAETENSKIERTFNFKQDGTKLTGDTSSTMTVSPPLRMARWKGITSPLRSREIFRATK